MSQKRDNKQKDKGKQSNVEYQKAGSLAKQHQNQSFQNIQIHRKDKSNIEMKQSPIKYQKNHKKQQEKPIQRLKSKLSFIIDTYNQEGEFASVSNYSNRTSKEEVLSESTITIDSNRRYKAHVEIEEQSKVQFQKKKVAGNRNTYLFYQLESKKQQVQPPKPLTLQKIQKKVPQQKIQIKQQNFMPQNLVFYEQQEPKAQEIDQNIQRNLFKQKDLTIFQRINDEQYEINEIQQKSPPQQHPNKQQNAQQLQNQDEQISIKTIKQQYLLNNIQDVQRNSQKQQQPVQNNEDRLIIIENPIVDQLQQNGYDDVIYAQQDGLKNEEAKEDTQEKVQQVRDGEVQQRINIENKEQKVIFVQSQKESYLPQNQLEASNSHTNRSITKKSQVSQQINHNHNQDHQQSNTSLKPSQQNPPQHTYPAEQSIPSQQSIPSEQSQLVYENPLAQLQIYNSTSAREVPIVVRPAVQQKEVPQTEVQQNQLVYLSPSNSSNFSLQLPMPASIKKVQEKQDLNQQYTEVLKNIKHTQPVLEYEQIPPNNKLQSKTEKKIPNRNYNRFLMFKENNKSEQSDIEQIEFNQDKNIRNNSKRIAKNIIQEDDTDNNANLNNTFKKNIEFKIAQRRKLKTQMSTKVSDDDLTEENKKLFRLIQKRQQIFNKRNREQPLNKLNMLLQPFTNSSKSNSKRQQKDAFAGGSLSSSGKNIKSNPSSTHLNYNQSKNQVKNNMHETLSNFSTKNPILPSLTSDKKLKEFSETLLVKVQKQPVNNKKNLLLNSKKDIQRVYLISKKSQAAKTQQRQEPQKQEKKLFIPNSINLMRHKKRESRTKRINLNQVEKLQRFKQLQQEEFQ